MAVSSALATISQLWQLGTRPERASGGSSVPDAPPAHANGARVSAHHATSANANARRVHIETPRAARCGMRVDRDARESLDEQAQSSRAIDDDGRW